MASFQSTVLNCLEATRGESRGRFRSLSLRERVGVKGTGRADTREIGLLQSLRNPKPERDPSRNFSAFGFSLPPRFLHHKRAYSTFRFGNLGRGHLALEIRARLSGIGNTLCRGKAEPLIGLNWVGNYAIGFVITHSQI